MKNLRGKEYSLKIDELMNSEIKELGTLGTNNTSTPRFQVSNFISPFQTYLWERRRPGRPNHQEVCQRVCWEEHCRQDRPFPDHRYSRRFYISIFASRSPSRAVDILQIPPTPLCERGGRGITILLFQYFIIVEFFDVILVLALLLNQKGEEISQFFILVLLS